VQLFESPASAGKEIAMEVQEKIKSSVRKRYTEAVTAGTGCCGGGSCGTSIPDQRVASVAGYTREELQSLPEDAVINSFGCGNPLAFSGVERGDVVIDIGSGAGIDCLLAAEKVGVHGKVIGIDMTPVMIDKARANARKANAANVEFRFGDAEDMPVDTASADWIISNCVINLSPNKPAVFREAFRVLRPGGRLSVSDIMVEKLPWILRRSTALYTSCVAGAIPEKEYVEGLQKAGFTDVRVTERIVYDRDQILHFVQNHRFLAFFAPYVEGKIWSSRIMATKPND
jgi:arsenite methyltransferase